MDDVLAFLNVVIDNEDVIENYVNAVWGYQHTPLLNVDRVGIMGGSRGGSPAYLAKIRDRYYNGEEENQIHRALITIGSASNFFIIEGFAESCRKYIEYDGYVPEETYHYYNTDYNVFARVLEPYLHGDLTFNEARKKLIRSSPLAWAGYMENVQVHHGMLDTLARPAQTEAWIYLLGQHKGTTEFRLYEDAYHLIEWYHTDEEWDEFYVDSTGEWLQAIIDG